jgi:ABC-type multidrug transport system permease subunit
MSNRWRPFVQLIVARVREFSREPEVLFWVYGFPLLLAFGLGIAFAGREPERPKVDVVDGPAAAELADILRADQFTVGVDSELQCRDRLVKGKTALVLAPRPTELGYIYDPTRSDSVLARYWAEATLLRSTAATAAIHLQAKDEPLEKPGTRYIDFLLPGLLGMNLMGGGLFGVGFVLVDMRVRKLFKRLLATPLRHSDFLLSLLASRLLFMVPEMVLLLLAGWLWFGVPMHGSIGTLLATIFLGGTAFAGLGLLLGCRAEKTETISGYINLVMLPSYLLSGVFFSSERFPDAVQPLIQAMPLTQLNDALRAVMLEGAGVAEVGWRLGILALWTVVCFALGLRWFRWR